MALCFFVHGKARAFDIEAHRGGRALFPENTLQSFANALSMGVDTLELDIGVSQDGVIVVSHERGLNPDLARTAEGVYVTPPGIPFVRLRLAEIKKYDVGQIRPGSGYAAQFPEQRAVPNTPISNFGGSFGSGAQIGRHPCPSEHRNKDRSESSRWSPDPKRFVELLLAFLDAEKFSDRVMVQSFDWRTLQLVQQLAPAIPTVYLTQQTGSTATVNLDKSSPWTAGFNPSEHGKSLPRTIKAAGGAIWSPYFGDVDPALISECHKLGLAVVVWTVNKPADIARMIDMGVDGIISDNPELLRRVADEHGIRLPSGAPVTP